MNRKTANKLVQATKKLHEAMWLCDSEVDGLAIRKIEWTLIDFLNANNYGLLEDSRGYHAVKRVENK
jgi:hypothetical protein